MSRIAHECGGQLIYLLRHPVANSISRTVQPRLDLFLGSPYYSQLVEDSANIKDIRTQAARGTTLQRAVISWCFENLVGLKSPDNAGLLLTYEELVLNPEKSCDLLIRLLQLKDRASMLASFERPAINIRISRAETIETMRSPNALQRRIRLVSKWQQMVSPQQCREAQQVLDLFGIDAYTATDVLATNRYLRFPDTPSLLVANPRIGT